MTCDIMFQVSDEKMSFPKTKTETKQTVSVSVSDVMYR